MTTHWQPDYETGHDHIDDHHKELFQMDSLLDQAIQSNRIASLEPIVSFLTEYVIAHFEEEETLMKEENYAEYDFHHQQHMVFKNTIFEIKKQYEEGINKAHVIFKVRRFIDSLMHHIKTVDTGLAQLEGHHHG